MAKFFVGQRVKNARPMFPQNLGKTGIIHSLEFLPKGTPVFGERLTIDCDVVVKWDDNPVLLRHQASWQLEPVSSPGQKEFKAEDILTMPNLPDFKTMTPEFARAWGGA